MIKDLKYFISGVKELMINEKNELKEYCKDMWGSSFGQIKLKISLFEVFTAIFICVASVMYGALLTLWWLAYPGLLILFIWLILVWAMYFLLYRLGVIKWDLIVVAKQLKNLKITH